MLAIVGESGSGKSLTAQAILQLLPGNAQVSGKIALYTNHEPRTTNHTALRGRDVGMIFQEPMTALNPLHPVGGQIIEGYCLHQRVAPKSAAAQQKLLQLYEAVGLQHLASLGSLRCDANQRTTSLGSLRCDVNKKTTSRGKIYPHQLSGGERQRAMIAMAMANDPALLIADEPTTALDVTLQVQILALLKQLQRERNMGMIFITHDLEVVQHIADRVVVMRAGEIVEEGAVQQVFSNPQHDYTKMLLAAGVSGEPAPLAADAAPVLSCEHLAVRFPIKSPFLRRNIGYVEAVKSAQFSLRAGETLGVVGESGSGKSSLGYALLRLGPSEGPIVFLGDRLDQKDKRALRASRRDMQMVFQDPFSSLNPRMTVREIIGEGLRLHEPQANDHEARILDILAQVGLTPAMLGRYPHEFSGGQRQRIAIARAMVLRPKLVVLDEPTSALDRSVQKQVLALLSELQQSHGVAYIFISHDLRTVRAVAHQLMVLKRGEVVEQGAAAGIFAAPQHEYTQRLFAAAFGAVRS